MKRNAAQKNWLIDAVLLLGFTLLCHLDLTGVAVHQVLGAAVGLLGAYHFVVHRSWVDSVTRRFLGRVSGRARLLYVVDLALMCGFGLIMATGLAISTWLRLPLAAYAVWRDAHVYATVGTAAALALKLVLHRRWIANVGRSFLWGQDGGIEAAREEVSISSPRRRLLTLGGVAALAALFGIPKLVGSRESAAAEAVPTAAAPASLAADAPVANRRGRARGGATTPVGENASRYEVPSGATDGADTGSSCTVQCSHRCSYPGDCRRYVDADGNGRCDLGECV